MHADENRVLLGKMQHEALSGSLRGKGPTQCPQGNVHRINATFLVWIQFGPTLQLRHRLVLAEKQQIVTSYDSFLFVGEPVNPAKSKGRNVSSNSIYAK